MTATRPSIRRFSETAGSRTGDQDLPRGGNIRNFVGQPIIVWSFRLMDGDEDGSEWSILEISSLGQDRPTRSVTCGVSKIVDALSRMEKLDFPFACQVYESKMKDKGGRPYLRLGDVPPSTGSGDAE